MINKLVIDIIFSLVCTVLIGFSINNFKEARTKLKDIEQLKKALKEIKTGGVKMFDIGEMKVKKGMSQEERVLEDSKKYFKDKEFCLINYAVVAFKDKTKDFKDFYYITDKTLVEKSVFEKLLVLDPIDISNKYLNQMIQVNNSHTIFMDNTEEESNSDFESFIDNVNRNYYENYREFNIIENPEKHVLYRIVATSNYNLDNYTERVIVDNMRLNMALELLPVLEKRYGEESDTYPRIFPVIYKPFIWTP